MPKFNHAVDIAFTVISDDADGNDFTPAMLRAALMRRIVELNENPDQWLEAVGAPFDTYEMESSNGI